MRTKDPKRPLKCIYCEYKHSKGKFDDNCDECGKESALIFNWLPRSVKREAKV